MACNDWIWSWKWTRLLFWSYNFIRYINGLWRFIITHRNLCLTKNWKCGILVVIKEQNLLYTNAWRQIIHLIDYVWDIARIGLICLVNQKYYQSILVPSNFSHNRITRNQCTYTYILLEVGLWLNAFQSKSSVSMYSSSFDNIILRRSIWLLKIYPTRAFGWKQCQYQTSDPIFATVFERFEQYYRVQASVPWLLVSASLNMNANSSCISSESAEWIFAARSGDSILFPSFQLLDLYLLKFLVFNLIVRVHSITLRIVKGLTFPPGTTLCVSSSSTAGIRIHKLGIVDRLLGTIQLTFTIFVIVFVFPIGFSRGFSSEASMVKDTWQGLIEEWVILLPTDATGCKQGRARRRFIVVFRVSSSQRPRNPSKCSFTTDAHGQESKQTPSNKQLCREL